MLCKVLVRCKNMLSERGRITTTRHANFKVGNHNIDYLDLYHELKHSVCQDEGQCERIEHYDQEIGVLIFLWRNPSNLGPRSPELEQCR